MGHSAWCFARFMGTWNICRAKVVEPMALQMGDQDCNKLCEFFYHVHGSENEVWK